jgi:hypothetical protein
MTDLRLVPRVKALGNGKFRPEVWIVDPGYGTEDVFLGTHTAPTHAAAFALAQRLVAAAALAVEEPTMLELPPAWK